MLDKYIANIAHFEPIRRTGKVMQFVGLIIEASGPDVFLGEFCKVYPTHAGAGVNAEVVGFRDGRVLLMPYGRVQGIALGSEVVATGKSATVSVGQELLGRVVDAFCQPLDQGENLSFEAEYPLYKEPTNPLNREAITECIETGIKSIDSFLPVGYGQRIGIFSGSGVGKSTLLAMLAKNVKSDVNVIALIGERGREVQEFVHEALGKSGMKRTVLIVATADQPALIRTHAVYTATAIAEYFKDKGNNVLLMMDSLTRFAMAQREIGLAVGEPPTSRGYTPSVFSNLPTILERGGNFTDSGSITAMYTVLVDGDDFSEPVTDSVRSILDGHIVLTRDLANKSHYPPIDIARSVSRLFSKLSSQEQAETIMLAKKLLSEYEEAKDLIAVGAYQRGKNADLDWAIDVVPGINKFLQQSDRETLVHREQAIAQLASIIQRDNVHGS